MPIKSQIRLILPFWLVNKIKYVRNIYHLICGNLYDFWRFLRLSNLTGEPKTQEQYFALLTKQYHRLEKGLTFESPKPFFGQDAIKEIFYLIHHYASKYHSTDVTNIALNTVQSYIYYHREQHLEGELVDKIQEELARYQSLYLQKTDSTSPGGIFTRSKKDIWCDSKLDLKPFFSSRHSIRDFSSEPVPIASIQKAVLMAQHTPTVCNRQSCRVHIFTKKEEVQKILRYQNGNEGFNHSIDKLAVIVSDLNSFVISGERFQRWIEGGMFSMSFVYALHALGLGSCCLNWSVDAFKDKALRRAFSFQESEEVIMMIAIGNLPDTLKLCDSARKDIADILIEH